MSEIFENENNNTVNSNETNGNSSENTQAQSNQEPNTSNENTSNNAQGSVNQSGYTNQQYTPNPQNANQQYNVGANTSHSYTWSAQGNPGYGNPNGYYNPNQNQYYANVNADNGKKKKKEKKGVPGSVVAILVLLCVVVSVVAAIGGAIYAVKYLVNSGEDISLTDKTQNTGEIDTSDEKQSDVASAEKKEHEDAVIIRSESQPREALDGTVAAAVEKSYNSVVVITTETIEYDTFYGQYINSGAGSGVIISENGYILTCAHVIDGASTVTVTTTDGTIYNAEIIGYDEQTDIGVVKIDGENLTSAIVGDSDKLVIGETTIAIGNPLGTLGGTVTSGILSALDREIEIDGTSYHLLQTNAEINPGNSGGGLFNIDGELIGVVNAKSSGSGVEGLGFAIPVNEAVDIAEQLINNGYIKGRPAMGISIIEVSEYSDLYTVRNQYPKLLNYITDYGVYITEWTNGDFQFGDRIIAIDDVSVSSYSAIKSVLAEHEVGDKIIVTVARINDKGFQSKMTDVEVTLIESVPQN